MAKFKERYTGIKGAFRMLDEDSDGFITRAEFAKGLKDLHLDSSITGETVDAVARLIDYDQNDCFDWPEFTRFASAADILDMGVMPPAKKK